MDKMMLKKQYMMYAPKKKGRLPSAYQEVEYIESTGTQYIDSGYVPSATTKTQVTCIFTKKGSNYMGITGYETNGRNTFGINDNGYSYFGVANQNNFGTTDVLDKKLTWEIDNINKTYTNGEYSGTWSNTYSNTLSLPFYFFVRCDYDNGFVPQNTEIGYGWLKFYESKIYENEVLQRNFIPCYRKIDNEVGLYDIVENKFYTNSGSGSFLKGKDVIYTSTNAVNFATDSWSTIQAEAERISNFYEKYGFIPFNTPYGIYNPENNDTNNIRTIIYNNEEIQIAIIGMCHDILQTSYSGGGTKAGITWQTTKSLFKSAVDSSSAYKGWSSCSLRASLNSTHFNSLPQEMQNAIKVVAKKSNNGSGSITTTNDKLFTLSMVEIMGTTKRNSSTTLAIEGEGTQYEYYKNAPLIKDSNNITWTGLSGTKGTCIANGNSYMTLIDGVQTPDANDYINYRNAKEYKPSGNASYYSTRSFREAYNECMYVWRAGNITYTTASNSDLEVCFAGCI